MQSIRDVGRFFLFNNAGGVACLVTIWLLVVLLWSLDYVGIFPLPNPPFALKYGFLSGLGLFVSMPIIERACRSSVGAFLLAGALIAVPIIAKLVS